MTVASNSAISAQAESPSPPDSSTTTTVTIATASSGSGPSSIVGSANSGDGAVGELAGGGGGGGGSSRGVVATGGGSMILPAHQGYSTSSSEPKLQTRLPASAEESPDHHGSTLYNPHDHHHQQQQQQPHDNRPMQQVYEGRYSQGRYSVAIKLLVSNNVAGSIIGRQGQAISDLQSRSMTRIKLSQSGDYFPGTHDRVCLVQGEPGNIKTALRMLLERMRLLQEQESSQQGSAPAGSSTRQAQTKQTSTGGGGDTADDGNEAFHPPPAPSSSNFVVRLLVPSSSCGMIIGKAGSNIKFLEESTGVVSVRLSPKDQHQGATPSPETAVVGSQHISTSAPAASSERALTITGHTLESCLQCTFMVFEGMISHPDVSRYLNMTTSYVRKTRGTNAPAVTPAAQPCAELLSGVTASGGFGDAPAMMLTQHAPGTTMIQPAISPSATAAATSQDPLRQPHPYQQQHHRQPHQANSQNKTSVAVSPNSNVASGSTAAASASSYGGNSLPDPAPASSKVVTPNRVLSLSEIEENDTQQKQEASSASFEYKPSSTTLSPAEAAFAPGLLPPAFPLPGASNPDTSPGSYNFPGATMDGREGSHRVTPAAVSHSGSSPDLFAPQLPSDPQSLQFPASHEVAADSNLADNNSRPSPQMATTSAAGSTPAAPNHSYLIPVAPTCLGPNAFQAQIAVPDSMIGSILGRAGRTLTELQHMSGTRIWISQRGEFIPGTRNRVVTVRGPTAQSVWQTQMFIGQRIVLPPTAAPTAPTAAATSSTATTAAPAANSLSTTPTTTTTTTTTGASSQSQSQQTPSAQPPPASTS